MLLRICKYLALACFLAIISFEVYFRIIRKEQWVKHEYPKIYIEDTICGYHGVALINGIIKRPGIYKKFQLNNNGFYGPDFTSDKPDSIFRIIITGQSGVEGIWSDHCESFPIKLQKIFHLHGYKNVEIINCGISGTERDYQNIKVIEKCVKKYTPDIILHEGTLKIIKGNYHRDFYENYSILYCGDNYHERVHSRFLAEGKVNLIKQKHLITNLWDISYLTRLYIRRTNKNKRPSFANCMSNYVTNKAESWQYCKFTAYDFNESLNILNGLNTELKECGCKLILFDYTGSQKKRIIENRDKINFSYIFLNTSGGKYSIKYDGHLNELGHEEIAYQLYNKLSRYFIPPEFSPTKQP